MNNFMQDLRYGIRVLTKSPGFAIVAVLALALGIGATSAIFSVVNAILLKPLPFESPERIFMVMENNLSKGWDKFSVSPLNFYDWRDQNQVFDHLAAVRGFSFNLTGGSEPERIRGVLVSAAFFQVVGVRPAQGRAFTAEEEQFGRDKVIAVGHALWQRRFGGDPNLLGQAVTLNGQSYTVVAIMPPDFQFPNRSEIWAPLSFDPNNMPSRGSHFLSVFGRIKEGSSLEQARAEMSTIAGRLEQQYPDAQAGWGANVFSLTEQVVGDIRPTLQVLLGAVLFVLLIACANVANLLLARATARHKEIAIRTALGAGRWRLIKQLLTESLVLSLVGGGLGLLLGYWGVKMLIAVSPDNIPRSREIGLDWWVVGFTFATSVVTGIAFGLAPALAASKIDLNESLKEGGRTSSGGPRHRVRNLLVVLEVASALVLLIGAGLMLKSFTRLQKVDPGFNPDNILTMTITLPNSKYRERERQGEFYRQLLERVESLPGVEAAGITTSTPLSGADFIYGVVVEGRPEPGPGETSSSNYYAVNHDYFRTMQIPLLRGRYFTRQDTAGATRVAIINESMARKFFSGEDPLGKRIHITNGPTSFREIVGIVGDVKHNSLSGETTSQMYEPHIQNPNANMVLAVRGNVEATTLTGAVRAQVLEMDKDQPVSNIKTMEQVVSETMVQSRLSMLLLSIFAAVALLLASVGLYGVMSYTVTQRTREIGIRMALGAQQRDVVRMIVGQGMALALIGVALGLAGAFGLTRLMTTLLFGVSATDPITFVAISLLLTTVASVASFIPARKAMKVDPMIALRYE